MRLMLLVCATAVAILALAALAGCGGGNDVAEAPDATATIEQVAQPSTEAAAAAYLKITKVENPRLARVVAALDKAYANNDAAAIKTGMEQFATLNRRFQTKLVAIAMPESAADAADAMVTALGRSAASAEAVAADPYAADGEASLRQNDADVNSAARILRDRLELPPPPKS